MAKNTDLNIPHGPLSDYVIGLLISILLTGMSFAIVMIGDFDNSTGIILLSITAFMQVIAQSIYFLHMKNTPDQTWNIIAYAYTILQVLILLLGSVWIMWHLHFNMIIGN